MPSFNDFPHIFTPIKIRNVELKNRLVFYRGMRVLSMGRSPRRSSSFSALRPEAAWAW